MPQRQSNTRFFPIFLAVPSYGDTPQRTACRRWISSSQKKNSRWHQIGTQITQTGTALRFTGKNAHAIMVMLKIVSAPISIPLFQTSAPAGVIFLQNIRHTLFCMAAPLKQGLWKPAVLRELPVFPL